MTNKKKTNTKRMKDYENEKVEIAEEMGIIASNDVEVNAKIASQNEAKFSKKTRTKQHNLNNPNKTVGRNTYK